MTDQTKSPQLLLRVGLPLAVTWLLIGVSFLLPLIDSTRPPFFDLTDACAQIAYWVSLSATPYGAAAGAGLILLVLITRSGIDNRRRWTEVWVMVITAVVFAGGGSSMNERLLKEELRIPRPNVIWLAGENGSGPLGMTPHQFYRSGDKAARSEVLKKVLNQEPTSVALSERIERHWIAETGYSFPSGHSFGAMFFATFLMMIGASYIGGKRLWFFYPLLPWVLAVCYSRSILRLHTPTDITVGSLQGIAVGLIAYFVARQLISRGS